MRVETKNFTFNVTGPNGVNYTATMSNPIGGIAEFYLTREINTTESAFEADARSFSISGNQLSFRTKGGGTTSTVNTFHLLLTTTYD